jgi:hypothetical protein
LSRPSSTSKAKVEAGVPALRAAERRLPFSVPHTECVRSDCVVPLRRALASTGRLNRMRRKSPDFIRGYEAPGRVIEVQLDERRPRVGPLLSKPLLCRISQVGLHCLISFVILDALTMSIIGEAVCTQVARKAYSLLFQPSLYLAPVQFDARLPPVDGRFPWVAKRRTNIACPRDRALSRSRTAILPGGSAEQQKRTESRKHHACSPQTTLCLFLAVSRRSALCRNAPWPAMMPRRLDARP